MAATLLLPPLSNCLQFPYNSIKLPKRIFSSKPPRVCLTAFSSQTTTSDDNSTESGIEDLALSSSPSLNSGSVVKVPTAPWMKGPLLVEQSHVLDLSKARSKKGSAHGKSASPEKALNGKAGAGRGKKEMKKIFHGIKKLTENKSSEDTHKSPEKIRFKFLPGELWGDGTAKFDEEENKLAVAQSQKSSEELEFDFPLEEVEGTGKPKFGGKMPWEVDKRLIFGRVKKENRAIAAELSLDKELLQRLRGEAAKMREWVKVKKAGVTQTVVDQVLLIWKNNELAMLKFDLPLSRNMERAGEIVEMKTGGLVVWRTKDALVIYRGDNYQLTTDLSSKSHHKFVGGSKNSTFRDCCQDTAIISEGHSSDCMTETDGEEESLLLNGSLFEKEADRLLDGLGPRFIDWWFPKPLPVDGDLLPEMVPGFSPPFRLCPPRSRSKLMNDELTYLRKLAQSLPTHFVLGRNRKLQGLAAAILKLWEKCHIAKIAVKWGIPNTDNKQMAYELKRLTGGVLLLRNKFIIILYRGKDFLPPQVAELVAGRKLELSTCQFWEETVRQRASETLYLTDIPSVQSSNIGTLSEYQNIQSECVNLRTGKSNKEVKLEAEKEKIEKELRNQQRKLFILKKKIEKSANTLAELNSAWRPAEHDPDQEMMTQEERECLRKMGLKMETTLVLGRRGVFDGLIESLYQHWKHREIVKVITMQRMYSQVIYTAKFLETESRGTVVSIEKLKEGHAIILYRGKNYRRSNPMPVNLLNKREALSRSLEMQRIGSLKFFANQSEKTISDLKSKLAELMERRIKLMESC